MAEKSLPKEISITVHEDEKSATVKVGNRTTSMVVPVLALFKNAEGKICRKLAICLWDGGERGDDLAPTESNYDSGAPKVIAGATHERAGREWIGGTFPGMGGTDPMDIMWRFFQWSVGNE